MQRFAGRVAFVTGAASGIGRATALRLAAEGARVFAVDREEGRLTETVAAIAAAGGEAWGNKSLFQRLLPLAFPIAEPEEIAAAVAYLASDEARFVNGAVFSIDGGQTAG